MFQLMLLPLMFCFIIAKNCLFSDAGLTGCPESSLSACASWLSLDISVNRKGHVSLFEK